MKHLPLLLALLAVLVAPLALRPKAERGAGGAEQTLVVITPHNEAIRSEFARGFERWRPVLQTGRQYGLFRFQR